MSFTRPVEGPTEHVGFSTSHNLFSIEVDGRPHDLVGDGQKSGFYWALGSGNQLWQYNLEASVSGGIAIADGVLVLGAATPQFAPFVTPGTTIRAFTIGTPQATPIGGTPVS